MAELTIQPSAIREALERYVESFTPDTTRVEGLHSAMTNELLEFSGGIVGLALNLDVREIGCVLLGDPAHIEEGQEVRRTGDILSVPVGDAYLGRVVNAIGDPLDGKGEIVTTERRALELQAPTVVMRQPVREPLQTGIKAVDAMTAIGRLDAGLQ